MPGSHTFRQYENQERQVIAQVFAQLFQRLLHAVVHCLGGDVELFRYLAVGFLLETVHDEYFPVRFRQCVDGLFDSSGKFLKLIKVGIFHHLLHFVEEASVCHALYFVAFDLV